MARFKQWFFDSLAKYVNHDKHDTDDLLAQVELLKNQREIRSNVRKIFEECDTNNDGRLSVEECQMVLGGVVAKRLVQVMDSNRDGEVSTTEWWAFFDAMAAGEVEAKNTFLEKTNMFLQLMLYRLQLRRENMQNAKDQLRNSAAAADKAERAARRVEQKPLCRPDQLKGGPMFEIWVDEAAKNSDVYSKVPSTPTPPHCSALATPAPTLQVPQPIRTCCRWIEEHGLQTEGVFRIPGDVKRMKEMQGEFNRDFNWQPPVTELVPNVASTIIYFLLYHKNSQKKKEYMWGKQGMKDVYYLTKKPQEEWVNEAAKILLSFTPGCRETLFEITDVLRQVALPENSSVNRFGNPDPAEATHKVALCIFPDIMTLAELMMSHWEELYEMTH